MCGIVGRYNFLSSAPVETRLLERMCKLVAHRGPDGEGVYTDGSLGFGHRRLAIIDLTPAAHQPMVSDDGGFCITYNGEVYNFQELRSFLKSYGYHFRSNSDTEVVLTAYRHFGVQCLQFLHGMFAFAIWDTKEHTLFLARDRVGKKPLFYWMDHHGIAFASEPKSFLADPSFKAEVNLEAISHYLSYQYVPSPNSAFQGVHKLDPAHYLIIKNGNVTKERYWNLSYKNTFSGSEEDAQGELLVKLKRAVKSRLVSDVPLGVFLSGGVDSSVILALMAQLGVQPLKTFSIGFEQEGLNELPFARKMANRYATTHEEFVIAPRATEIIPKLVWHHNEPFADSSALPTFYLSQLARQHVTVTLNGDGGDENLAGYRRYHVDQARRNKDWLYRIFGRSLFRISDRLTEYKNSHQLFGKTRKSLADRGNVHERIYAHENCHFFPKLKQQICTEEFLRETKWTNSTDYFVEAFRQSDAPDSLDASLDVDVRTYLPNDILVKMDIATMAYGLESRAPFLDHEVMEFCASLPSHMKLRGPISKYILKQGAQDMLPQKILHRPKMGFTVPIDHWFKKDLREMAYDTLLSSRAINRGYFHKDVVTQLLDDHVSGTRLRHKQLWNLLMLELWHQMFIDEGGSARLNVTLEA